MADARLISDNSASDTASRAAHVADVATDQIAVTSRPCGVAVVVNEHAFAVRHRRTDTRRFADGSRTVSGRVFEHFCYPYALPGAAYTQI
jgi:hypothetical protein